jgi:hypothetical protein
MLLSGGVVDGGRVVVDRPEDGHSTQGELTLTPA